MSVSVHVRVYTLIGLDKYTVAKIIPFIKLLSTWNKTNNVQECSEEVSRYSLDRYTINIKEWCWNVSITCNQRSLPGTYFLYGYVVQTPWKHSSWEKWPGKRCPQGGRHTFLIQTKPELGHKELVIYITYTDSVIKCNLEMGHGRHFNDYSYF